MSLKCSDPHFNQCGPWFGHVQIGASAPLLQIFHVAETSMMFKLLLRVCVKKLFFLAIILDTFPFKMSVGKTLGRPEKAREAIFDSASKAKGKLWPFLSCYCLVQGFCSLSAHE